MHIHPNNNLQLASLGFAREETQAIQAKRAAEVRRKLSAPLRGLAGAGDGVSAVGARAEEREGASRQQGEGEGEFGRLFSARA